MYGSDFIASEARRYSWKSRAIGAALQSLWKHGRQAPRFWKLQRKLYRTLMFRILRFQEAAAVVAVLLKLCRCFKDRCSAIYRRTAAELESCTQVIGIRVNHSRRQTDHRNLVDHF